MNGINPAIANLLGPLNGSQRTAYVQALTIADGGYKGDGILTQAEFNKGNEAFSKTDVFTTCLPDLKLPSFNADAVWKEQGAKYNGMEKQAAYYKEALGNGNKDRNGNPVAVTQEQLNYAKDKGFGDTNGDNKITGLELAVADVNGDGKINFKDGDITGDGKVNASEDIGIYLSEPTTTTAATTPASGTPASDGLNMENFMAFFQQFMKMLLPNTAMQIPTMPTTKTT
jgi:hypothetical protein